MSSDCETHTMTALAYSVQKWYLIVIKLQPTKRAHSKQRNNKEKLLNRNKPLIYEL